MFLLGAWTVCCWCGFDVICLLASERANSLCWVALKVALALWKYFHRRGEMVEMHLPLLFLLLEELGHLYRSGDGNMMSILYRKKIGTKPIVKDKCTRSCLSPAYTNVI